MYKNFAQILNVIVAVEKQYGLASLDPVERAILYFVIRETANGNAPTVDLILSQNFASRATVYRRIASLEAADLVGYNAVQGVRVMIPCPRFQSVPKEIGKCFNGDRRRT